MDKILLVEDSVDSKNLAYHALGENFAISWVSNLDSAFKALNENHFNLILLDVVLPDGDGFRFFSMLLNDSRHKETPVMFLTAKGGVADKVLGISLGADDYIIKPFEAAELKARVEMRLKKRKLAQTQGQLLCRGSLELDLKSQRAFLATADGKKTDIELTPSEFKLLFYLASHEEQIFSRNQLLDAVRGTDIHLTDRCIDTYIYTLRKKLGEMGHHIHAVYGEGYRFSPAAPRRRRAAK